MHAIKIAIDEIEENPGYRQRRSPWIDHTYRDLRNVVERAGLVRIIVEKRGNRHVVVIGHHLLKAARECGLKEAYAEVIDTEAEEGQTSPGEDLRAFRSGVEEILWRAAAPGKDALPWRSRPRLPQPDVPMP